MKNLCLISLIIFPFVISAQELIQNPNMRLVIDEQKAETVFADLGLNKSFILTQSTEPEDIERLKEAIQKTFEFDYFKIGGWEKKSEGVDVVHLSGVNEAIFLFHLQTETQYIITEFEPLKAGQAYRIQIDYNFRTSPSENIKPLGIFLTNMKTDWQEEQQPNFELKFISNQGQKAEEQSRKQIIQEYQSNYGGFYDEDFMVSKEVPQYSTQEFTYIAQGGESFLVLGRVFENKKRKKIVGQADCEIHRISMKEIYDTRD